MDDLKTFALKVFQSQPFSQFMGAELVASPGTVLNWRSLLKTTTSSSMGSSMVA